jgi:F0F1-type ATP synthase epsilon subunit
MVKRTDASTGKIIDDGKPIERPSADANGRELLQIKVYSPYKIYFDEPAYSITAVNRTGQFDILPRHHNFITLLEPCELAIDSQRGTEPIKISGGIMHVRNSRVVVFLDV